MIIAEDVPVTIWSGCYEQRWQGRLVPDAFSHPAKMSRALLVRIYNHLLEQGVLQRGDTVLDPFVGIGTTAIEGANRGIRVIGVELEPKFVGLARENVEKHRRYWEGMEYPIPVIVQGDSRNLRKVLDEVDVIVSSPPYVATKSHPSLGHPELHCKGGDLLAHMTTNAKMGDEFFGQTPGQLNMMPMGDIAAVISSPPYADQLQQGEARDPERMVEREERYLKAHPELQGKRPVQQLYGASTGQMGALPMGTVAAVVSSPPYAANDLGGDGQRKFGGNKTPEDNAAIREGKGFHGTYGHTEGQLARLSPDGIEAIISSPPYAEIASGAGGLNTKPPQHDGQQAGRSAESASQDTDQRYGETEGQLARMNKGEVDAVVSSPPFQQTGVIDHKGQTNALIGKFLSGGAKFLENYSYGSTEGQLGAEQGETFWAAAHEVVKETYAILKPGGVAVWVVKAFVRNKARVDFPGDWRKLCEHVGFETVEEIHALFAKERTVNGQKVTIERKSFFRRLAEKKGSPRIDWEVVWVMRKP